MADSLDARWSGTRIGKYEIVQRLAFGGMAEIYLARVSGIQGFEKFVVLKRILPQFAADAEFVRMFLREARLAATLDQANIGHVHDIGEVDGSYFYTMEYLHGEDLRAIMRTLKRRGLRLPLEHAIDIILGAASGLHYAHEKKGQDGRPLGIVHRDVSPSNVIVTFDGGVKVVDFGIAKVTSDPDLSRAHSLKGKLTYMSPEQLNSEPVDRRSDVFSLGVVLFEITTHKRLFKGTTDVEVIRSMLNGAIPRPTQVHADYPVQLEGIVMQALEANPSRRYPTVRALQRDLEEFAHANDLHVSSAALAEWMEGTFGPKKEAWHGLAPATPTPPPTIDQLADPPLTHADESTAATVQARVPKDRNSGPTAAARRRRITARVAIAGVAGVVAAAAVFGLVRWRAAPPRSAEAARPAPVVMVVAEGGQVAVERGAGSASAPAPAAPQPVAAAVLPADVRPSAAARPTARAPHRRTTAAAGTPGFSAALARRERELRACFGDTAAKPADGADEIAFRFQIRTDGRVSAVDVLPASVAATARGACLERVAAGTVFPPQPAPLSFRIPVSLRLRVVGKTSR